MFTDPQLGHIGLHEQEARKVYRNVRTASMPMKFVARALETDMSEGLMKGVVDDVGISRVPGFPGSEHSRSHDVHSIR